MLTTLSLGNGLLVGRAAGVSLPGPLVLPAGLAAIVVFGQLAVMTDATAELAAPAAVGGAVLGGALSVRRRVPGVDAAAAAAAVGVFAAFAAPVVLSGEATFAGYIKLDDTATFLALTDRVMEHGRSLAGLAPSTYEATLAVNLAHGYPLGTFVPFGVGAELVGEDTAWLYQPYIAFLAAMLALALYALLAGVVASRLLRAVAALVASQPALLYGYSLWGGVKEVAAAALLALTAALVTLAAEGEGLRRLLPVALAFAATLGVLSLGGALWLLPAAAVAALLAPRPRRLLDGAALAGGTTLLALPALGAAGEFLRRSNAESFTNEAELGNLAGPLSVLQVAGIWPAADFRLEPAELGPTRVLIALVLAVGVIGAVAAWKHRAWAPLVYVVGSLGACALTVALGSPWLDAKALAIASPAVVLSALAGVGWIYARGRRIEALVALVAVGVGVLWSNTLAYREVSLAPRDRLEELEQIGERFAGEGPALMTEYEPYGVRHFLRRLDAEGASELRRRPVPLREGRLLGKAEFANLDRFDLNALLIYPTLVLRRSPTESRPPAAYRLRWAGRYYEVWQRGEPPEPRPVRHLPLDGRPDCDEVAAFLGAGDGRASVVAAPHRRVAVVELRPETEVSTGGFVTGPRSGTVWIPGSSRGRIELAVDGRVLATRRAELNPTGQLTPLAGVRLGPGRHTITVTSQRSAWRPSEGGVPAGPAQLVIGTSRGAGLLEPTPRRARSLCARRLDWIEIVRRRSPAAPEVP